MHLTPLHKWKSRRTSKLYYTNLTVNLPFAKKILCVLTTTSRYFTIKNMVRIILIVFLERRIHCITCLGVVVFFYSLTTHNTLFLLNFLKNCKHRYLRNKESVKIKNAYLLPYYVRNQFIDFKCFESRACWSLFNLYHSSSDSLLSSACKSAKTSLVQSSHLPILVLFKNELAELKKSHFFGEKISQQVYFITRFYQIKRRKIPLIETKVRCVFVVCLSKDVTLITGKK